ncbi:DUF2946 family protein [Pigmentiphaga soli]
MGKIVGLRTAWLALACALFGALLPTLYAARPQGDFVAAICSAQGASLHPAGPDTGGDPALPAAFHCPLCSAAAIAVPPPAPPAWSAARGLSYLLRDAPSGTPREPILLLSFLSRAPPV